MASNPVTIAELEGLRKVIHSSKGGWRIGEGVRLHGLNMLEQLMGRSSYWVVVVLSATGKRIDERLARWFDACFISMSFPDARIWCNTIAAFAGTAGTRPTPAICAGILASDSKLYGGSDILRAGMERLGSAMELHRQGLSGEQIVDEWLRERKGVPAFTGFDRPIADGDLRIAAFERVAGELGLEPGEHLCLAYSLARVMQRRFDKAMNMNAYCSAFLLDQGFTPEEAHRIFVTLVLAGLLACYSDTRERPAGSFLPLRCDDVDYVGPAKRSIEREGRPHQPEQRASGEGE